MPMPSVIGSSIQPLQENHQTDEISSSPSGGSPFFART
jgi:hypothetical protein